MRHVSELTTLHPHASEQPTTSAGSLTEQHIALLWERMTMIYGHKWTSSYGEKDDGTWRKGLADVSPEQIGTGLDKCRTSDDEWPPTLPMFRSRCLVKPYAAPCHREFPKMLERPRDRDAALSTLANLKDVTRRADIRDRAQMRAPVKAVPFNDVEFDRMVEEEKARSQ